MKAYVWGIGAARHPSIRDGKSTAHAARAARPYGWQPADGAWAVEVDFQIEKDLHAAVQFDPAVHGWKVAHHASRVFVHRVALATG